MSGPARQRAERDDPALDPGVLAEAPLAEFNGYGAVRRHGGCAVLPWRSDHLAAARLALATVRFGEELPAGTFDQALVRVQKGRAATYADLLAAWRAVRPAGRLLVAGGNDVGIASWCRRLAADTASGLEVLANHSHSRVAALIRPAQCPSAWRDAVGDAPGVFVGGALDAGSALLIDALQLLPEAQRVLDLGCGAGHLGLAALRRWSLARVWMVDADARAVACAAAALAASDPRDADGARARGAVTWWDVTEPLPQTAFDVVLCNPPCHAGTAVDFATARAMFRVAAAALAPGGILLVVANRHLPYEADLAQLGTVTMRRQEGGFKILELRARP